MNEVEVKKQPILSIARIKEDLPLKAVFLDVQEEKHAQVSFQQIN